MDTKSTRITECKTDRRSRFFVIAFFIPFIFLLILAISPRQAVAGQIVFAWDANTEPDLSGYKLYYGTVSGTYGTPVNVGNATTYTLTGLTDGQTYYSVLTAYDTFGNESGYSNEVAYAVPSLPGGTGTPANVVVSISATDATATEAGPTTGQYTVTRSAANSMALTVTFSVGGTATSGSDFTSIGASVTIPAGATSATITVTPINDTAVESDETVVVTLSANAAYTVGSSSSATITIASDDVPATGIIATPSCVVSTGARTVSSPSGAGRGTATIGSASIPLAVRYTPTGGT